MPDILTGLAPSKKTETENVLSGLAPTEPNRLIFSTPPEVDTNEINKRSKDVLDMATTLEMPISQAEKNYDQFKRPPIFSMVPFGMFPTQEAQFHITEKAIATAKQSIDSVNASQAITDAFFSGKDLIPLLQEKDRLNALEPITGENFASDTFYKGVAVAAPMFESLVEASPFAAVTTIGGAIIAGIAGNLLGGAGAPEELITVPAGAKAGLAVGTMFGLKTGISAKTAEYWYRQGVGEMIYSMNKNGVDMKYAGPIAAVAGIPYAAIEFAQISQLTPGLRQGVQNIGVNSMLKAFTAAAKKYGTTYVTENVEEVLQEGIVIAAEDIGNLFQGNDLKFDKEGFIERANRLARTSTEAGQAMLLLPLPGAVVDVRTGVMQVKKKNQFVDAVQKQIGVPKKAAVLAADMLKEGKSVKEVDQMLSQVKAGIEAEKVVAEEKPAIEVEKPPTEAAKVAKPSPEAIATPEGGIIAEEGAKTDKGRPTIIVPDKGLLVFEETDEGLKLQNIDVVEAERRKGVGTAMVKKAEEITGKKFTEFTDVASPEGKAFIEKVVEKPEAKQPTEKVKKPKQVTTVEEKRAEERDILGGVDPINQIQIALKKAKAVQPLTEQAKKAELKRRAGAAAGTAKSLIAKGVPVEEALRRSTAMLKGPLTEYDQVYESIADILEPGAKNEAELMIWRHPELRYFEKLRTDEAFNKLINGSALTPGDVTNIERVFGKTFEEFTKVRETVSGLYERAISLWKAGLLTGIKTTGLNTLANASHAITETAKDIPAAGVDSVVSLFTKERTLAFTTKGVPGGVKEGVVRGWKYLTTGIDARNVGEKLDYNRVNFGTSKVARGLQAYEETIFHLLGAEDQPFYYGAKARSLYSQATAQAKNKALKGKEQKAFVDNLIQKPTDDMLEWATHDAEVAVFQNRTAAGDIAKGIQKLKGGEIVVPFGRTPAAVATQVINYTPIGAISEIAKQIKSKNFDQRKFSQASGRSILGTGALYLGTLLFVEGMISLDFPDNEKERKLWEAEGRKSNSIKIGDKWRDVQVLGPAGNLLIIGGHFQKALEETGSPAKAMVRAMTGGAKSFTEQTFVRGVSHALDAITDPERSFDRWFTSMAGSVVPTIVSDIARAQDEIERRSIGPKERIQSRIPFYRQGLPPKISVFGQDLPRYGGNVLETMIDPTRPSKIRQDVVIDELRRLWDKDIKVSPTQLGDKKGYDILTTEENTQLWRRSGELVYKTIFAIVNGEGYKDANDFAKGKIINIGVNKAKAAAKAEIVNIKLNEGKTILELAESGLLSIDELEMIKYFQEQE